MLCSTGQLDPHASVFRRWRSLRWEICTAHPLSRLGEDPRGHRPSHARASEVSHLRSSTRTVLVSSSSSGMPKFHSSLCDVCLLET